MQFNNKFKYVWWVIVIGLGIYMIYLRYDEIISSSVGAFDIFLVAIIAALMLIPFFTEMDFLGIKLKQEIVAMKTEVKEEISEVRGMLKNSIDINNNNRFNPSIYVGSPSSPPPDNQLNNIEKSIKNTLDQILAANSVDRQTNESLEVPEENKLLFAARFNIEKELRRIWKENFYKTNEERSRPIPINIMINDLIKQDILPPSFKNVIREIYSVCSPAIHGEEPTQKQVDFIKDVAQDVINTLKVI
ncbi:hypothetical protein BS614_11680 [Paenibacillus xylanexedens]|uniref:hypothetical protein n=1 Tax=Paenibacillus xylanexedens TaxID=528191 RepID=UPI0009387178|nr:hypothetical protein [Paenibacillus xylanexedens]APO44591.1 hypothetical protein BS614_11680 [Paenibacillus xylanexedens]